MAKRSGIIGFLNTAIREAEKAEMRHQKIVAKIQALQDAQNSFDAWRNYIFSITHIHDNLNPASVFYQNKEIKKPILPKITNLEEKTALENLNCYTPSFFDKLFRLTEKKIHKLKEELKIAKYNDLIRFHKANSTYNEELGKWNKIKEIINGIENNNIDSIKEFLDYSNAFNDISLYIENIEIENPEGFIDAKIYLKNDQSLIPNNELKLTATGKISKKNMPETKKNEIYYDHVSSLMLSAAISLFNHLPINVARISALKSTLNPATGNFEWIPILSFIPELNIFNNLNLEMLDPSSSLSNFKCNVDFKKNRGFNAIKIIELS